MVKVGWHSLCVCVCVKLAITLARKPLPCLHLGCQSLLCMFRQRATAMRRRTHSNTTHAIASIYLTLVSHVERLANECQCSWMFEVEKHCVCFFCFWVLRFSVENLAGARSPPFPTTHFGSGHPLTKFKSLGIVVYGVCPSSQRFFKQQLQP
eukprot:SAG31_NODE_6340_length_2057_cov_2.141982_3_plen_152_part_00